MSDKIINAAGSVYWDSGIMGTALRDWINRTVIARKQISSNPNFLKEQKQKDIESEQSKQQTILNDKLNTLRNVHVQDYDNTKQGNVFLNSTTQNLLKGQYLNDELYNLSVQAAKNYRQKNNINFDITPEKLNTSVKLNVARTDNIPHGNHIQNIIRRNQSYDQINLSYNFNPISKDENYFDNYLLRGHEIGHGLHSNVVQGEQSLDQWVQSGYEARATASALKQFFANFYRKQLNGNILRGVTTGKPFIIENKEDAQKAMKILMNDSNLKLRNNLLHLNSKGEVSPQALEKYKENVIKYMPEMVNNYQRQRDMYGLPFGQVTKYS